MITKAMKEMKLTPEAPEMSHLKSHLKQLLAVAAPEAEAKAKAAPLRKPRTPEAKARKRVCDKAYHKGKKQAKIAGKSPEMISYAAKLAYYHAGSKWDEDSSGSD